MSRSYVGLLEAASAGVELFKIQREQIKKPVNRYVFVKGKPVALGHLKTHAHDLCSALGCQLVLLKQPLTEGTLVETTQSALVLAPWGILRIEPDVSEAAAAAAAAEADAAPTPTVPGLATPDTSDAGGAALSPPHVVDADRNVVRISVYESWTRLSVIQLQVLDKSDVERDETISDQTLLYAGSEARFHKRPDSTTLSTIRGENRHVMIRWNNLKKAHTPFFTDAEMHEVVSKHWAGLSSLVRCCVNPESTDKRKYAVLLYDSKGYQCIRCHKSFATRRGWKQHYKSHDVADLPLSVEWRKMGYENGSFYTRHTDCLVDNPPPPRRNMDVENTACSLADPKWRRSAEVAFAAVVGNGNFVPRGVPTRPYPPEPTQ